MSLFILNHAFGFDSLRSKWNAPILSIFLFNNVWNLNQILLYKTSISNLFTFTTPTAFSSFLPHDHLLLESAPNLGRLISRWEINKFENCWYKSVRILEVSKLLFQQFLNLSSSQRDISGSILGDLSNNRWSVVFSCAFHFWVELRASKLGMMWSDT
jgi:hypothetical protein